MAAFLRMTEFLKPNGGLYLRDAIFSFPPREYKTAIDQWIQQVAKPEGQGWTVKDFEMHVRQEYSTFAWIIEGMLKQAGFDIVEVNYQPPAYAEYLCINAG